MHQTEKVKCLWPDLLRGLYIPLPRDVSSRAVPNTNSVLRQEGLVLPEVNSLSARRLVTLAHLTNSATASDDWRLPPAPQLLSGSPGFTLGSSHFFCSLSSLLGLPKSLLREGGPS